jgi:putrescine---pyruvate transaminase
MDNQMLNGMNYSDLSEKDKLHHFHPYINPVQFAKASPTMITHAEGIYLYTSDGQQLIDGRSGGWCTNIGYGNERVCKAAYDSMRQLSYSLTFGLQTNPWVAALSDKMSAITPDQYEHFLFGSTGSDAVESAIKMSLYYWYLRGQPKKRAIIGRDLGYHGNTLLAAHLVGEEGYGAQYGFPLTDIVHRVDSPYWYRFGRDLTPQAFGIAAAASLEKKILQLGPEHVAAFIAEPVQASLGMIIPPSTYFPEIQRICQKYDVLLISDEVVTGMGKTGQMFGFQSLNFQPDMFTMAKGLSSGYFPMSCVAIGAKVGSVFGKTDRPFIHGFTYCGHPVGAAVALENIAVIEDEGLIAKVRNETGPHLATRLKEFLEFPFVGEVTSMGIIGAIEIDISKVKPGTIADSVALGEKIADAAWKKGVNARPVGSTFGMMFPMIISKEQIDTAIGILKDVFAAALHSG